MANFEGTIKQRTSNNSDDVLYPATKASLVSGLATVATSGSYNDLTNKPTIPSNSVAIYKGTSSTSSSNTTSVSILRLGYVSGTLYIWTS